jgi:hypothetical protein
MHRRNPGPCELRYCGRAAGFNDFGIPADASHPRKKECSFLKKRTKNFCSLSRTPDQHPPKDIKVFCFFFSKKKAFSDS